jgi:hypothetical protein
VLQPGELQSWRKDLSDAEIAESEKGRLGNISG